MTSLEQWIDAELPRAALFMQQSISCAVVKRREGFGQVIRCARGSIVASPVPASYDPDPDYFFCWFRDSAVIVEASRQLHVMQLAGGDALQTFADFLLFNSKLRHLDGGALVTDSAWRERVAPDFEQFVRPSSELLHVRGAAVYADTRVNPDGSLDISRWARPQHDGPALRLLTTLRWLHSAALPLPVRDAAVELAYEDTNFVLEHWPLPCYDIWEEELGMHFYTMRVAASSLEAAARFAHRLDDAKTSARCRAAAADITLALEGFWDESSEFIRSRTRIGVEASPKDLDIAVILAAIHADDAPCFSPRDARMHATLDRLDALFDSAYVINAERGKLRGPALGRYAGDVYYSGGAYFFSTFGAAEYCYRAARDAACRDSWMARGDGYMEAARAHIPVGGDMAEQFDQRTGAPSSARHLAWSYAAFITAALARAAALQAAIT